VLIETLDGGRRLASHNSDVTFNPASVMKLATSLVALAKLSPEYRYRTNILADGVIDSASRVLEGDLVIDGSADPMFSSYDAQEVAVATITAWDCPGERRATNRRAFLLLRHRYHSNLSPETSASSRDLDSDPPRAEASAL